VPAPGSTDPLVGELRRAGLLRFYRATSAGRAERRRLAAELAPRLDRISRAVRALKAEVLDAS
jgi:hypothetical protein